MTISRLGIGAVLTLGLVSGCGGGEDKASKAPTTLNRADDRAVSTAYERLAEAVADVQGADEAAKALQELEDQGLPSPSPESTKDNRETALTQLNERVNTLTTALGDEPPTATIPSQRNQTIEAFLRAVERRVAAVDRTAAVSLRSTREGLKEDAAGGPSAETPEQVDKAEAEAFTGALGKQQAALEEIGYDVLVTPPDELAGNEDEIRAELEAERQGLTVRVLAFDTSTDAENFEDSTRQNGRKAGTYVSRLVGKVFYSASYEGSAEAQRRKVPEGALDEVIKAAEGG